MCDDEEFEYGLYCFSAPIYDANHRLIAAISVSGPKTRMLSKSEEIKSICFAQPKDYNFSLKSPVTQWKIFKKISYDLSISLV